MNSIKLSNKYAFSLFTISKQLKNEKDIFFDLQNLIINIFSNTTLSFYVFNKFSKKSRLYDLCNSITNGNKYNSIISTFLKVLIDNKRLFLIDKIIQGYNKYYYDYSNKYLVEIIIMNKNNEITRNIQFLLKKCFKKKIFYNIKINKQIVAGFKIKIKNFLLDYSLQHKIKKIKNQFSI